MTKRRLLWVGDAGVSSGFARATHYTCAALAESFDVSILGLNYRGDPHNVIDPSTGRPFDIYPCWPGGDMFGLGRIKELITKLGPSVIVVQNDPWNFQPYLERCTGVPVVGAVAVDGKNCQGTELNGLAMAIFWTQFAEAEAKRGGYTGASTVIPLGVDLDIYKPLDKMEARARMRLNDILPKRGLPEDAFIVGVVGRNQPRKRLDLTLEYFAEWVHSRQVDDAVLWLHVAPTGEKAYDLRQLANYYGISNRIMTPTIEKIHGVTEDLMCRVYNIFDVMLSTSQGEGFGLPVFEGMACGIPQIVGDWSALGELTEDAAMKIWCSSTAVTPHGPNVIGGIPDRELCVHALDQMYRDYETRKMCRERGLRLVQQDRYRWENIGNTFLAAVENALAQNAVTLAPMEEVV
jgi:D-inositol-3-phosphate glycosyltransferase